MAAAVGSLIMRRMLRPAMAPASLVACLCESLKYAGTVTTAFFTSFPKYASAISLKSSIECKDAKDKIPAADKKALLDAIHKVTTWMEASLTAEKEEYDEKQKEVEAIAVPILKRMASAGSGMPNMGGMAVFPDDDPVDGPHVEEID